MKQGEILETSKSSPADWMKTIFLILLGLWCLMGLAGCVQGQCEATVNWDGSAALRYELNLDFALPDSFPQERLDDFAASHGYQSSVKSDSSSSQIMLSKKLASFEDLPAALQETVDFTAGLVESSLQNNSTGDTRPDNTAPIDIPESLPDIELPDDLPGLSAPTGQKPEADPRAEKSSLAASSKANPIIREEGIFMDNYHISANVDLSNVDPYAAKEDLFSLGLSFLFDAVTTDADLKFILHLPVAAESSNATTISDNGKTLEWKLIMGQNNLIKFDLEVPNLPNIALAAGLLLALILISLALYWFLLRQA